MNVKPQTLKSDIQVEREAIKRIFNELPSEDIDWSDVKEAIVTAYYLHNLYNAFESIFRLVASAFENHIPDAAQWHTLLLSRMGRDIEGIRPRLLSDSSSEALDELRCFRHLFRHVYQL